MRFVNALLALSGLLWAGELLAVPQIQHWETSNGAQVYFVPAPQLPMVDARVVFNGGSARDGERPGLAVFTNSLLEEGAGGLSDDQIAERFSSLGARFDNDALRDMALIELRSLTEPKLLDPAVETAALVIAKPDFPPQAIERERQRILVALKSQAEEPGDIASKLLFEKMYGAHPYGHRSLGEPAVVSAITRDELVQFHRHYYVAHNAVVAIVGDLERAAAEQLAERLVGALPAGESAPPLPLPEPVVGGSVRQPFPSSQTHIYLGQPLISRQDPDYFPLLVGNHILGGSGLVSRISQEVREKRGLSYSAFSGMIPMQSQGPFLLGLQTRNEKAEEALAVLQATLTDFVAHGPSAEELVAAKKNLTGGFALSIDSNADLVAYLAAIGFYHLPLDHLDTYIARVEAVTADQIRSVFQRRVKPQAMAVIAVGGGAIAGASDGR